MPFVRIDPEGMNFGRKLFWLTVTGNDLIYIQIPVNSGRSIDLKKAFYERIVDFTRD